MSLTATTTYNDMLELLKTEHYSVYWKIEARIYIDGKDIPVNNTINLVSIADFENRYYADSFITVELSTIAKRRVLENLQSIEVVVIKTQIGINGQDVKGVVSYNQRFNGFVTDATNDALRGAGGLSGGQGNSTEELASNVTLTLQLIEPFISVFRAKETGGIYSDTPVRDVLLHALSLTIPKGTSAKSLSHKSYMGIRGVDIVPPNNTRTYNHIVIPSMTRIVAIPKHIQDNYGIYTSGLGWHIERGTCYLYPLMDYNRYTRTKKVLTILNVPVTEAPTLEKTFIVKDKELFVFATGDVDHTDLSENVQQNIGNGLQYNLAGELIDGQRQVSNNKAIFNQGKNVKQFTINDRPRDDNVIHHAKFGFTDNPYNEMSQLSIGIGTRLSLKWENSNRELVYPGMPVKVLYKSDGKIHSAMGILVGATNIIANSTGAVLDNHYVGSTLLNVHVKQIEGDNGNG